MTLHSRLSDFFNRTSRIPKQPVVVQTSLKHLQAHRQKDAVNGLKKMMICSDQIKAP